MASTPAVRMPASEPSPAPRASRDERFAAGKLVRDRVPREKHGGWRPLRNCLSPVDLVNASNRVPKPLVEIFDAITMIDYAALCGWTLARAHARSRDAAMISGYLGKSDLFDRAIARFSRSYADQTERDHAAFMNAIRKGRIEAQMER